MTAASEETVTTRNTQQLEPKHVLDLDRKLRPSGWLLEAETGLGRAIDELAVAKTTHDATTLDLLIRLWLAPEHQLRAVDLCIRTRKSPSHMSRVIDRTERDGLTRRQPDPNDRRAQYVVLTKAGEQAVDVFAPLLVEVLDRVIFATLSSDEIETLVDLLTRISTSAQQLLEE